jgi:hypothetical protein
VSDRLVFIFCGVSLALLCAACKKTQARQQRNAFRAVPMAAAGTAQAASAIAYFSGEVNRGQKFEKSFAPNTIFRLEPYAGNDSGWSIRIVPGADAASQAIDCIGAIEEPAHGDTKLAIDLPADSGAETASWKKRDFSFVGNAADCKTAWQLMNDANYGTNLSDKEREEASAKLGKIPTQHATFRILETVVGPRTASNEKGTIERLKFEVEFAASATAAPKSTVPQSVDVAAGKTTGIRAVNVMDFIRAHVGELNPDLADLETDCGEGQDRIQSLAPVQYGDLDGDGEEEAAVEGWSCLSGNVGVDFWGVLKLLPGRKIAVLPIEPMPKTFKGRNPYEGLRGHMKLEINGGRLLEIYPTYPDEHACNNCSEGERRFVYRWDGHQFILDDIIEVPPDAGDR